MLRPNTTASPRPSWSTLRIFAAGVLALLVASPALGQQAVDGDTLRMCAESIRLFGIDAPELAALIAGRNVECTSEARDRYGRTVATCTADGDDIGAAMVANGWAWAFTRYSGRYLDLQHQAEAARLGVHDHRCELPADYRAAKRATTVPALLK